MRRSVLLMAVIVAMSNPAAAETSVRVGVVTPALQFDFLYSDFGVDRVRVERDAASVGEPDLLVALQLAQVSGIQVDVILGWRRDGVAWDTITRNCHQDARIYYVDVPPTVSGPPYGRACGYWRKHGKQDLKLTDAEIRELVLVRALSKHCGESPAAIVQSRLEGKSPRTIATGAHPSRSKEDAAPPAPAPHGHGHDRGHDHGHGKSR